MKDELLNGRIPLNENDELNGYQIIKAIGAGGFSIVYKAKEIATGTMVAIKEFYSCDFSIRNELNQIVADEGYYRPSKATNRSVLTVTTKVKARKVSSINGHKWSLKKAKQEIEILVRAKKTGNKNIAKYIKDFEANKTFYLIMELYNDKPKSDFTGDLVCIENNFKQLLNAIAELHLYNYIHRDIHPRNILWDDNDNPVLIDFGMSMFSRESIDEFKLESSLYSPESIDNDRFWFNTDLYAAASVAYFWRVGREPPLPIKRKSEGLLPENRQLDVVINKATSLVHSNRYEEVSQLLNDLDSVFDLDELTGTHSKETALDNTQVKNELWDNEGRYNSQNSQPADSDETYQHSQQIPATDDLPHFDTDAEAIKKPKRNKKTKSDTISERSNRLLYLIAGALIALVCSAVGYFMLNRDVKPEIEPKSKVSEPAPEQKLAPEFELYNDNIVLRNNSVLSKPINKSQFTNRLPPSKESSWIQANNACEQHEDPIAHNTLYINYKQAKKYAQDLNVHYKLQGGYSFVLPTLKQLKDLADEGELEDGIYLTADIEGVDSSSESNQKLYDNYNASYLQVRDGYPQDGSVKVNESRCFTLLMLRLPN